MLNKKDILYRNEEMLKMGFQDTLNYACAIEDIEDIKKRLVNIKTTKINKKCSFFGTPMNIVCEDGNLEIVKLLVEAGADIESKNNRRQTPLMVAISNQNETVVKYLIEKGADVKTLALYKMNALHYAAPQSSVEMIKLLISKGCDMNQVDSINTSVLEYAVVNQEVAMYLLNQNISQEFITPAFKSACTQNRIPMAKVLLEKGADINIMLQNKGELLYSLCGRGLCEAVKFLIEQGINFNFTNKKFKGKLYNVYFEGSPRDRAVWLKQDKMVELLDKYYGK